MNEQLIIEIWDSFRDFIPENAREDAANQFVEFLVSQGSEPSDLEAVLGYDSNLDTAIERHLEDVEALADDWSEDDDADWDDDSWDDED